MIRMNEMTWMEFKAKIDEGAITILPIGACEQHGPHLPLCRKTGAACWRYGSAGNQLWL